MPCDSSCIGCDGLGNGNCLFCNTVANYKNASGLCVSLCPAGTVNMMGSTCGCAG